MSPTSVLVSVAQEVGSSEQLPGSYGADINADCLCFRLPSTSTPTCSSCSEQLLNHLAASVGPTSALNGTIIEQAMGVVNNACGTTFVTDAVVSASRSVAGRSDVWIWAALGVGMSALYMAGAI